METHLDTFEITAVLPVETEELLLAPYHAVESTAEGVDVDSRCLSDVRTRSGVGI